MHKSIPLILSVCDALDHRLQYDGKTVVIFGSFSQGFHGSWLTGQCEGKLAINGTAWPYAFALASGGETGPPPALPPEFRWSRTFLVPHLPPELSPSILRDDPECQRMTGWAAFFGRFETKATFERLTYRSGETKDIGFGDAGESPAQLSSPGGGQFCLASEHDGFGPGGDVDASRYFWSGISAALTGADGLLYFESLMGALLPGPAVRVRVLKGTVLTSTQTGSPTVLTVGKVGLQDTGTPEATLRLSAPSDKPITPGTQIEFEGIVTNFTTSPFMVTFDIPPGKLTIATGQ